MISSDSRPARLAACLTPGSEPAIESVRSLTMTEDRAPRGPSGGTAAERVVLGAAALPEPDRGWLAAAEQLPIDSVWHGGHILPRTGTGEVVTRLSLLTAWTERVRVGSAVAVLPLYHPVLLAKQLADLDSHSGGRLSVGVGVGGEFAAEFDAMGVPVAGRGARTDEAIGVLRALWSGRPVTSDGPLFPLSAATLHPVEVDRRSRMQPGGPPIIISGRKAPAMRRAARLGDGWMPYLYSPDAYARSVATVRAEADAVDRTLGPEFEWAIFLYCSIRADGDRARRDVADFLGAAYGDKPAEMLNRIAPSGTPDEVARSIQAYVDAGARHIVISPATPRGSLEVVTLAATEVLPQLSIPSAVVP